MSEPEEREREIAERAVRVGIVACAEWLRGTLREPERSAAELEARVPELARIALKPFV